MKTKEEILKLIRKADAGDSNAQYSLAIAYYKGDDIVKNVTIAMSLFEVSANNGNMYAQENLAQIYRYGMYGYATDLNKAFKLYRKSAEQGNISSQENLGVFYDYGYGTLRDYEKAVEWYLKAAEKGRIAAQNNLGVKYQYGQGVEKNYAKAFFWYRKAAANGSVYAQCNLGIMYEEGNGVDVNYREALKWYKLSASNEHERAIKRLKNLKEKYDENTNKCILAIPEFISNPFRVLGVFSNASAREITANKSKAIAFDKIKKKVEFPIDTIITKLYKPIFDLEENPIYYIGHEYDSLSINELYTKIQKSQDLDYFVRNKLYYLYEQKVKELYSIKRDEDSIAQALVKISQPIDKIKYALFWFINVTPLDQTAIEYLMNGNVERACELWDVDEDEETFSSLINCALTFLILEDEYNFVRCMTTMIHSETYRNDFVHTVCGETVTISEEELSHMFIDVLHEKLPDIDWTDSFHMVCEDTDMYHDEDYIDYLDGLDSINKLTKEIEKNTKGSGVEQYNAALSLMELSKVELTDLLPSLRYDIRCDLIYQSIADKVANKIISLARNYYRECSDTIYLATKQCVELNEYAYEIAEGTLLKSELKDSLKQIREKLSKMPPERAITLIDTIMEILNGTKGTRPFIPRYIDNSIIQMLEDCVPYIVELKEILGCENELYIEISTKVADKCIDKVINKINKCIEQIEIDDYRIPSSFGFSDKFLELQNELRQGWQVFIDVGILDLNKNFKEKRYIPNLETLESHMEKFNIKKSIKPSINLMSEIEYFQTCRTLQDFENYISKYPQGKFYHKALDHKKILVAKENALWERCRQDGDYSEYLKKYKDGRHSEEAKKEYAKQFSAMDEDYWLTCLNVKVYSPYSRKYNVGKHRLEALKYLKKEVNSVIFFALTLILLTLILCIIYFAN